VLPCGIYHGAGCGDEHQERDDAVHIRAEALLAIGRDVAWRLQEPGRSADHGELLYDAAGLPQ
jgi:hypothetical protein